MSKNSIQAAIDALTRHAPVQGELVQHKGGNWLWRPDVLAAIQAAPAQGSIDTALPKTWRERAFAELGHRYTGYKHDSFMEAEIADLRAYIAQRAAPEDGERKRINAYETLVKALRSQLNEVQKQVETNLGAAGMLASERAANAQLTAELEIAQRAASADAFPEGDQGAPLGYLDDRPVFVGAELEQRVRDGWVRHNAQESWRGLQIDWKNDMRWAAPAPSADEVPDDTVAWLITLPDGELELGTAYFDKDEADDYIENDAKEGCYLTELIVRPPAPNASAPSRDDQCQVCGAWFCECSSVRKASAPDAPAMKRADAPTVIANVRAKLEAAGFLPVGAGAAPDAPAGDLPPLPETRYNGCGDGSEPLYTPDMMHAYVLADRAAVAPAGHAEPARAPFQHRVQPWMMACFGPMIAGDAEERNHRFFEEATELVQACGMTAAEAHELVDYTFGRPVGEKHQEVGGVMVTLAALCLAQGLDMHDAAEVELARIWTKVDAIRAKQAAKPKFGPLPAAPVATELSPGEKQ
ncbi:MAG TPA: hypothetical protein VF800_02930 [Telluria sp.]|jgi:hypothetical protein